MALFGLILLLHQAPSIAEGQQGEKRIEADMYRMAKDMESGQRISAFQSQSIVNQFQKLGEHIKKETSGKRSHGKPFTERATPSPDKKMFRIQPIKNAIVQISYSKPQGDHPSERHSAKRRQQPTYFINFNFQNRGNSKPTVDQSSPTIQPKMLRTRGKRLRNGLPNPFESFPLKGEDI
ncbi:Hypothetical predicted protein [Drosophila guanche]|uniref:Uncharacterized protein n=1 Tax=Drosophila guanche TaxID=7266 RepID=A0A3B0JDD3_DROGU|nr:Hypothetical predicted protein [Drosophila guanche]